MEYSDENVKLVHAREEKMGTTKIPSVNIAEIPYAEIEMDGKKVVISPKQLALYGQMFMDQLRSDTATAWMGPYIEKDIIWSFVPPAAFTDGVRIAMNPVFLWRLMKLSKMSPDEEQKLQHERPDVAQDMIRDVKGRLFRYVITHEVYHQLYNHLRREALEFGVLSEADHEIANIAQDLEINRDIEYQMPVFSGATELASGVWYKDPDLINKDTGKPFEIDAWEDIYKYFLEHTDQIAKFRTQQPKAPDTSQNQISPYTPKYSEGWKKAIDAIINKKIDANKFYK